MKTIIRPRYDVIWLPGQARFCPITLGPHCTWMRCQACGREMTFR